MYLAHSHAMQATQIMPFSMCNTGDSNLYTKMFPFLLILIYTKETPTLSLQCCDNNTTHKFRYWNNTWNDKKEVGRFFCFLYVKTLKKISLQALLRV